MEQDGDEWERNNTPERIWARVSFDLGQLAGMCQDHGALADVFPPAERGAIVTATLTLANAMSAAHAAIMRPRTPEVPPPPG